MSTTATQNEIAKLAYELWELRGRPIGSPEIDWHTAEAVLRTQHSLDERSIPEVHFRPDEGAYRDS
jgi:hypothetical protein